MLRGVGLGFRRDIADQLINLNSELPRFVEFAPENWMGIGGSLGRKLKLVSEKYPILCHGLSLSLGSPDDLNFELLKQIKQFLSNYQVKIYSEHLSFSQCDNAHLYELLPLPFTEQAVKYVSERIRIVQDYLQQKIAIENVSYYLPIAAEMDELSFIKSVISEADCNLLLDVNNVYVNAFNHRYDPQQFISGLPLERVVYMHMAGHEQRSHDLIIDTHAAPIVDPVYKLFDWTCSQLHPVPILLERDYNFPELSELLLELKCLDDIAQRNWSDTYAKLQQVA